MSGIGSLAIKIAATYSSFTSGMKKCQDSLSQFGKSSVKESLATGGFSKSLVGAGIAAGVAATAFVAISYAIKRYTDEAMESLDATAKLSDRIGISTEMLAGLRMAAALGGAGQEQMTKGLTKFAKVVGDVSSGIPDAEEKIEALGGGLKDVFASGDVEASLKAFAEHLDTIPNRAQRLSVIAKVMGERMGPGLANTLAGGSKALQDFKNEAAKAGISFSREQHGQAEAAKDAWEALWLNLKGGWEQLAVAISPAVESLANRLIAVFQQLSGKQTIIEMIVKAFELMADGIASLAEIGADAFGNLSELLGTVTGNLDMATIGMYAVLSVIVAVGVAVMAITIAWKTFQMVAITAGWAILSIFTQIVKLMAWISGNDAMKEFAAQAEAACDQLRAKVVQVGDEMIESTAKTGKKLDDILMNFGKKVNRPKFVDDTKGKEDPLAMITAQREKLEKEWQKANDTLGMGSEEIKVYELGVRKLGGAYEEMMAKAKEVQALKANFAFEEEFKKLVGTFGMASNAAKVWELQQKGLSGAALDAAKSLAAEADMLEKIKNIGEDVKSPFEKFQDTIRALNLALKKGLIDQSTYAKGAAKAFKDLESAQGLGEWKNPSALVANSAEAYSVQLKYQNQNRTPEQRVEQVLRTQIEMQKAQLEVQKRIAAALAKDNRLVFADIGK